MNLAQARQPRFRPMLLDLREGHPVDARSTRIQAGQQIVSILKDGGATLRQKNEW
jgi:hypothetical protein